MNQNCSGTVATDDDGFPDYDHRDSALIEQLDNLGDAFDADVADFDAEDAR